MKKIQVGIIGAGRIGKIHATTLSKHIDKAQVKTISDPFASDLAEFAKSLNISGVETDYRVILNDPAIDAVIICSPTDTHADIAIEASKKGKHIFCEKPVDLSVEKIKETIEEVNKAKVKMQVGFNRRFDHNFSRLKELISNGDLGEIHTIRITSRDPNPPHAGYISKSGGIFMDMTIHDFDMALFLAASPVFELYAHADVRIDPKIGEEGDFDTAVVVLKFENKCIGIIENSRKAVYGYDQRIEVFGSKGSAIAENDTPTKVKIFREDGVFSDKPLYFFLERYMDSFIKEMKEFIDAIYFDKETPVSAIDGLMPVIMAKAAKESVLKNIPVKIK